MSKTTLFQRLGNWASERSRQKEKIAQQKKEEREERAAMHLYIRLTHLGVKNAWNFIRSLDIKSPEDIVELIEIAKKPSFGFNQYEKELIHQFLERIEEIKEKKIHLTMNFLSSGEKTSDQLGEFLKISKLRALSLLITMKDLDLISEREELGETGKIVYFRSVKAIN